MMIVLRNILTNAIKFSYSNAKIDIIYENHILSITDYGKGIEKVKLEQMFKQKMNPTYGTFHEIGFGIGLFLSYELMKKNGGEIKVKSVENKFTSFALHVTENR